MTSFRVSSYFQLFVCCFYCCFQLITGERSSGLDFITYFIASSGLDAILSCFIFSFPCSFQLYNHFFPHCFQLFNHCCQGQPWSVLQLQVALVTMPGLFPLTCPSFPWKHILLTANVTIGAGPPFCNLYHSINCHLSNLQSHFRNEGKCPNECPRKLIEIVQVLHLFLSCQTVQKRLAPRLHRAENKNQ